MNRNELAKELNVHPSDVDDWLLLGCPAKYLRNTWEFDSDHVKCWLKSKKIKIKRNRSRHLKSLIFDRRWFGKRCPICTDRGFSEKKAGRLYTLGEVIEGKWHLRRSGIPCGHSVDLNEIKK